MMKTEKNKEIERYKKEFIEEFINLTELAGESLKDMKLVKRKEKLPETIEDVRKYLEDKGKKIV